MVEDRGERPHCLIVEFLWRGDLLGDVELARLGVERRDTVDDIAAVVLVVEQVRADDLAILVDVGDPRRPAVGLDPHIDAVWHLQVQAVQPVGDVELRLGPIIRGHEDRAGAVDVESGVIAQPMRGVEGETRTLGRVD